MGGGLRELTNEWETGDRRLRSHMDLHVKSATGHPLVHHGVNGFRRFWIPPEYVVEGKWVECDCGWCPDLGIHYRRVISSP